VLNEVACDYFHLINPNFPERVKAIIDGLVREHALERDWVVDDHSAQLWTREKNMCMDTERRAELETLRKLLGVSR